MDRNKKKNIKGDQDLSGLVFIKQLWPYFPARKGVGGKRDGRGG